jgi:hypothetical protein
MQTGRLVLQILKRKDYKDKKIKGITKEFWGTYPYKVSLEGNNVEITDQTLQTYKPIWGKMYQWFQYPDAQAELGSDDGIRRVWNTKFVNSFTRHAYFVEKRDLDNFYSKFSDYIIEIQGPISKKHVNALDLVRNQSRSDIKQKVIRDRLYYSKFDSKLEFLPKKVMYASAYGMPGVPYGNTGYGYRRNYQFDNEQYQKLMTELQTFVKDIVGQDNCHLAYNNVYLDKDTIEEVAMYMKLKYADVKTNITEIIVIKEIGNR